MALGTNPYTAADLVAVIGEVWGKFINDQYRKNLKAAQFFLDLSSEVSAGGDIIHVPDFFTNVMSASAKSNGAEVTLVSPTSVDSTLTISSWQETSFTIDDLERAQINKTYNAFELLSNQAAYTTAAKLDASILDNVLGLSVIVNDSASDVVDADVRAAMEKLDAADVPSEDRAFWFHPTIVWHDLFGVAKYYDAATLGVQRGPVLSGQIPVLYGVPIIQTTNIDTTLTSYQNALTHFTAFRHAEASLTAEGDKVRVQSNYIPQRLQQLVTADSMFGEGENRDAAGVWIKSRSTGIVS